MQESITAQNTSTWSHSSGSLTAGTLTDWGTGVEETVCPTFWYFASMEPSVNLKQEEKKSSSRLGDMEREPGPREGHEEAILALSPVSV